MDSSFPRNLSKKPNVTPDIVGSQVNDGADTGGLHQLKLLDNLGHKLSSAPPTFRPSIQDGWPIGDVFVSESESKFGGIKWSKNRLSVTSAAAGQSTRVRSVQGG